MLNAIPLALLMSTTAPSGAIFALEGPGAYQDITKTPEDVHPITGVPIVGFQIPYWSDTKKLCRKAASHNKANRSIGWDVAITETGPSFVEGNHNWCKLLWQLPIGEGLRSVLDHYLEDMSSGESSGN